MSYELCYTSVPQGLRPGSRGYCTVGLTTGTPAALVETLESLSAYRPLFPAGSPRAADNPVSWAHWRVSAGGKSYSVLSRVCFAGLEYTKRSSVFAHHIALTSQEQPPGGPAWVMAAGGLLRSAWSEPPAEWPEGPAVPHGDEAAAPCAAWADACGDAGWAGVLAQTQPHLSAKPVYVIFPPGLDLLPLVREALALLPPAARWQTTFNTYHTEVPAGSTCAWRFVADGSPAATDVRRGGGGVLIDLTARLPEAADGPLVRAAREGASPAAASTSWTLQADADDAATDLMPVAPRGPAMANPRRAAAAPVAAAPADPTAWMPPASATVVAPARGRSSSVSPLAWAAAVAAGVVAASAAWYFPYASNADRVRQLTENVAALQTQADASGEEARVAVAKVDLLTRSQAHELRIQVAAARQEGMDNPDRTRWQPVLSASDPSAKQFTQLDLDRSVREAVAAAKKAVTAGPATAPATGTTESNGLTLRQPLAGLPADIAGTGNRYFELDRLPNPESKKELNVPLAVVTDAGPDLQVWLEPADEGDRGKCVYDRKTNALQRDLKGATGQETLARFSVEKSTVLLHWPFVRNDQERRDFLRRSLLVISDGQHREAVQFVDPQTLAFTLHDGPAVMLKRLSPGGERVVFSVPPGASWNQTGTDPSGATRFATPAGGPVVSFRTEGDRLACDYADLWTKIMADRDEKTKARNEQAAQLPKREKSTAIDIDRLAKDPLLKSLADRFKAASDAVETAAGQAKNMEQFPPVTAVVRLNNGVVTHKIDIRPGNAPAKH